MTCYSCYMKETSGNLKCLFPGCDKPMWIQESQLCRLHHEDQEAPRLLREYLKTYSCPFLQNRRYMAELATTINWGAVENGLLKIRGRDLARFRAFGSFLKTQELPEVLTWHAIDEALLPLGQTNPVKIGFIRSCLFELGNVLAERGELQDRSSHLQENSLHRSLQRCPIAFQEHVSGFRQWLLKGMINPTMQLALKSEPLTNAPLTTVERVRVVVGFLNFCATHDIDSLPEIGPSVIAKYQQTILWQFECRACHRRFPLESSRQVKKCANKECEGIDSYVRIRRLARGTFIANISHLRIFFDWAQLHRMVSANPFSTMVCGGARTFTVRDERGKFIEISAAIRRYDDAIVEKLCADIVSPNSEPDEAVILYFIIFHLFSNSDLRNMRIALPIKASRNLRQESNRVKPFEYLYLPSRKPTRGKRSVARTETRVVFPRKAQSWLIPILERFFEKRAGLVKSEHQQHFLVGEKTARCNKPVTKEYVTDRVRKVSLRALGGVITPSDLRRTAADIVALRSKRRGAILTAMGYTPLAATRFNYLERFPLHPEKTPSTNRQGLSVRANRR